MGVCRYWLVAGLFFISNFPANGYLYGGEKKKKLKSLHSHNIMPQPCVITM